MQLIHPDVFIPEQLLIKMKFTLMFILADTDVV